ncbi:MULTISPECIES: pseudouridine synthase [unclassified Polaromonas]|uniref:pseudouridine synthase n=1 Tax=unclassified Polaromonas TaxID=2638319 RepID=UPI000F0866D7|nr:MULTISPECIES: pseudouridine synthase [unclassified Polaromonas]AYQ28865.1 RNA pseudouridine synthase [Polaromonas sp. SP1]QGJ20019.1 RNA pseudouridine synthase [Polaromonas sp. Pch-P]
MKASPPQNNYPAGNVVATPVIQGVKLLHADESLLVLDKPAGLLSVPGRGEDKQDCLSARVQAVFADALIVHRLDQATSGLMLMARSAAMQRALSRSFETREVSKRYVAVVSGHLPTPDDPSGWGLIDLPIVVDWPNRPLRIIDTERGKPSQTRWQVLSHDVAANTTRVELEPVTGRSHQLRVHLKALGHPILGDAMYAPETVQAAAPRLLLHAAALKFTHPASGLAMAFESAPEF